jgi:hypothetical protein
MIDLTTRNATLGDLAAMLQTQQARKVDLVTPASTITAVDGNLVVTGSVPVIDGDGVTMMDGIYRPTQICDEKIAAKLAIPVGYLRRLRDERVDLYDANLNGWLHGAEGYAAADDRSFLLRTFKPYSDEAGIARTLLSDKYGIMDHLDVLTAALDGVKQAGVEVTIDGTDLTDRRMIVRVAAPDVKALAPTLLRGYRSPFSGASGDDNPTVFAGFVIGNSETGDGAFTITPRLTVEVCNNGMTITRDAMRGVHLGAKMDDGIIRWSQETMEKQLAVVTAKAKDAVRTFCDVDYMTRVITRMETEAGRPVETVDNVRDITKALKYTEEHTDGILTHFIKGGQMTRGGVMNAITAYTQTVEDADVAYSMENQAMAALTVTV